MRNQRALLVRRPVGVPAEADFAFDEVDVPQPNEGEIVIRHTHIGLQPAARIRMSEDASYAAPTPLGDVPYAQTVGEVTASRHPDFAVGDRVASDGGWQCYSLATAANAYRLDARIGSPSLALGVLGASGMTAYVGMLDVGRVKSGETVVVSAASGAVGAVAGQIAKIKGCRVVGIAGGAEKCAYVVDELGLDACIDHRADDFPTALAAACPDGIDVYFENVGGAVRGAVWPLMANFSRVALCGLIAEYNANEPEPGPGWRLALVRRIIVEGFLLRDRLDRRVAFLDDATGWIADGRLKYREDVTAGLTNAPRAFADLLVGKNFGKAIVAL